MDDSLKWTHGALQSDLYRRRQNRKATMAWSEVNIARSDQGRFDVFETRNHDAKGTTVFVGFEVKASVTDLESDLSTGKWKRYLPACDELYFAIPKDLCDYDDIPELCGVIYRVGERHAGRWNVARKPQGGHRTMSDAAVWRRLAEKGYWASQSVPRMDDRTRIERMRDYSEMEHLSSLISGRVEKEIRDSEYDISNRMAHVESLEAQAEQLDDITEAIAQVPQNLAAIETILRAALQRPMTRGLPWVSFTLDEAIAHLTEESEDAG